MCSMSPDELRRIRGSKIAMVYQEPMASLNPAMRISEQLAEVPLYTMASRARKGLSVPRTCWRRCGYPIRSAS